MNTTVLPESRLARVIENPAIGDRVVFVETSAESGGLRSVLEVECLPGGGNFLHYHTQFAETFTVLEGVLSVQLGTKILRLQPGESATVPIGVHHRFFNEQQETARFEVRLEPGSENFEMSMRIAYGLGRDGLVNKGGVPKSLSHLAILMRISETIPVGLMFRLLTPVLRWLDRRAVAKGVEAELRARYCK